MKQILQNLGSGETLLADVPCPALRSGSLILESRASLVSLGTEKMLVDFGKGGWIAKARSQPEKVKQVLQKIRTDGLFATVDAVKAKLYQPIPLGYSQVGTVMASRGGEARWEIGMRVVSNGSHAEVVCVPENLCARVPDEVSDEAAAFTVVGAIGLQGIRLLEPTLGERVVVMGLGLIGLMAVQMLRANGCRVLGIDLDPEKCALAASFGADVCDVSKGEDPVAIAEAFSEGTGVDGVLITASAKSDAIVHQAATMCRKRGRIVLVGVVGLQLNRADFYEKELSFQVSCSYGPGRYDPSYEAKGLDYPIGFVRWTEQRNMEAVLGLLAAGTLDVAPLISHRFPFDDALRAYEVVAAGGALGIVLEYPEKKGCVRENGAGSKVVRIGSSREGSGKPTLAFIGAGQFATRMLLPAIAPLNLRLKTVVSSTGVSGSHAARKFGFEQSASDAELVFEDPDIDTVFVTTRHRSHARYVIQALQAGKHVFVEKPLCLTRGELSEIEETIDALDPMPCLMVGYNRRFSPHTEQLKTWLKGVSCAKNVIVTVNAGSIPEDHWTQDQEEGGGRIVGEACHFIDLARFLIGYRIVDISMRPLGGHAGRLGDCATIHLSFEDGSQASVHYLANGHKAFPKERVEVFAEGKVLVCDNFRVTQGFGVKGKLKTRAQDKGHTRGVEAFLSAVRQGDDYPIPLEEILEVADMTLRCLER